MKHHRIPTTNQNLWITNMLNSHFMNKNYGNLWQNSSATVPSVWSLRYLLDTIRALSGLQRPKQIPTATEVLNKHHLLANIKSSMVKGILWFNAFSQLLMERYASPINKWHGNWWKACQGFGQHCRCRCPDAKAPGHQHPPYLFNTNCITPVSQGMLTVDVNTHVIWYSIQRNDWIISGSKIHFCMSQLVQALQIYNIMPVNQWLIDFRLTKSVINYPQVIFYLRVYSLHHNVLPTLQSIPLMTNGPLYPITHVSSCHGQHTMPRNPWSFPWPVPHGCVCMNVCVLQWRKVCIVVL